MKKVLIALSVLAVSCSSSKLNSDAHGNFEAIEVVVSSEGAGKIEQFDVEEGIKLDLDQSVGYIDTVQLHLKKRQLIATIKALNAKLPDIAAQVNVLKEQLSTAEYERNRLLKLVATNAATTKQLDDANAQIALLKRQIDATTSTLSIQTQGTLAEIDPLRAQIAQIEDQIEKSIIKNPISGTVLTKYAEPGELANVGRPLYKIANLDRMILKAYVAGDQLANIKIGQKVDVYIDAPNDEYTKFDGIVTWIADKAEFAPKVIQTKNERVNLVYAFKINVENDGQLKIGMPAEVKFETAQ